MNEYEWHYSYSGFVFRETLDGDYEVRERHELPTEGTIDDLVAEISRLTSGLSETEYEAEVEYGYEGDAWGRLCVTGVRPAREDELSRIASALNEEERQRTEEVSHRRAQYERLKGEFGD